MSFAVLWQGLLKVALDNAHIQEKQIQQEKKELRLELYREREIRENLERQLAVELQSRSKFNKLTITEIVNIVLEIFSVVIDILYILREKDIYEMDREREKRRSEAKRPWN